MANFPFYRHNAKGKTINLTIANANGQVWNITSSDYETYAPAVMSDYVIAATETPASSYQYLAPVPTSLAANALLYVHHFEQVSDIANTDNDIILTDGVYWWDGTSIQDNDSNLVRVNGSVIDISDFQFTDTNKDAVASDVWVQTARTITSGGILASDVWAVTARTLTAGTNLNIPTSDANATAAWAESTRVLTAGTNLNDITAASVWSVGTRALTDKSEFALTTANNNSIASDTWIQAARTVTDKTGYSLAATGLDSITATEPTGVATTFPQMLVQLWRRFFGKTTMTATQIKTYKEDGTTVVSTQTISDDNTTQTQGESS